MRMSSEAGLQKVKIYNMMLIMRKLLRHRLPNTMVKSIQMKITSIFYRIGLPLLLLCISLVAVSPVWAQSDAESVTAAPKVLVVTYSRTGNTKAVAQQIIMRFDADAVFIKAREYADETRSANSDAWNEMRTAIIEPEIVDMSQYNLVFLGSPIWWYRPAVPLWAFVEKNSFQGKRVVLFNTFNSRFKQKYIDEFAELIESKGGKLVDHLYVRRGRVIWQMSREELLEAFNKVLDRKQSKVTGVGDN